MSSQEEREQRIRILIQSVSPETTAMLLRAHDAVSAAADANAHAEMATEALRSVVSGHFAERGDDTPEEVLDGALGWLEFSTKP